MPTATTAASSSPASASRARSAEGIVAQRERVLDPGVTQPVEERGDLGRVVTDAGEVGHGLDAEFVLDLRHQLDGELARAPAGAVRHRHERGAERAELVDRLAQAS